mgnify:CR=1 FL=1
MNGQFQETLAVRMSIPEDRKQQIIVVLGQMMAHSLTETSSQGEDRTRKGREHSEMMKHKAFALKRLSCLKSSRCPLH